MPNWCYNHLTLSNDDKSKIDALQEVLSSKNDQDVHNGELFQHLRPRPEEFNESWYGWNVNNWGTKWEVSPDDWNLVDDNTISVSFDSPPIYTSINSIGLCSLVQTEPVPSKCCANLAFKLLETPTYQQSSSHFKTYTKL